MLAIHRSLPASILLRGKVGLTYVIEIAPDKKVWFNDLNLL